MVDYSSRGWLATQEVLLLPFYLIACFFCLLFSLKTHWVETVWIWGIAGSCTCNFKKLEALCLQFQEIAQDQIEIFHQLIVQTLSKQKSFKIDRRTRASKSHCFEKLTKTIEYWLSPEQAGCLWIVWDSLVKIGRITVQNLFRQINLIRTFSPA